MIRKLDGWRRISLASAGFGLVLSLGPSASMRAAGAGVDPGSQRRMPRTSLDWAGEPVFVPGQLLLALKPNAAFPELYPPPAILGYDPSIGVYRLQVPTGQEEAIASAWTRLPCVAFAEVNRRRHAFSIIPNDPSFGSDQWYLRHVNAPDGWTVSEGSTSIVIAIVDSGIDLNHPDLAQKILPGMNALDPQASVQDYDGHGTNVAGLAAAITDNGIGIAGLDWNAPILPVKVLDPLGGGDDGTIAQGIDWAANHGARVINLSLGAAGDSSTLERALSYARQKNAVVVAAAGNDYMNGDPVDFPGASPNAIAVGAIDDSDAHASYSETGDYIAVVAPGGDPSGMFDANPNHYIYSTYPQRFGSYEQLAGTSESTPLVSGLAALILSVNPALTPDQVGQMIESTADHLGPPGRRNVTFGYGRIDVATALRAAQASLPASSRHLLGDLNGDGRVTVADATLALQAALGLATLSPDVLPLAEVVPGTSGSDKVSVGDCVKILRWALGLDPTVIASTNTSPSPPSSGGTGKRAREVNP